MRSDVSDLYMGGDLMIMTQTKEIRKKIKCELTIIGKWKEKTL